MTVVDGQPVQTLWVATVAGPANGSYSATINWGDGDTSAGQITALEGGEFSISGSKPHPYAAGGSDSITVTVSGPGTIPAPPTQTTATVLPSPPVPIPDLTAAAGTAFSGTLATFTLADATALASSFSATITWGNGQTSPGTVSGGSGTFTVSGGTTYAQEGGYPVSVTVTRGSGTVFIGTGLAHVARVGPPPAGLSYVASVFSHSVEYYQNIVSAAYRKYLGRDPEPTGLAGWVNALQHGYSDERLEAGFIGSPEYIADHGGTGAAWIIGMYRDLLGCDPDAAGLQGWENALAGGLDPAAIAYGFAASPERETQRITADYQTYLGRLPEDAGVVGRWVNAFEGGYSNEDLVALFAGSLEYFQRHSDNIPDWLFSAYHDVLNRAPDDAGFQGWLQFLKNS